MDVIAKKIKALRRNKKLTQEELAEVLSVSPQAVSKWENGICAPDIELLPIIARYFGVTMDELFDYRFDVLNYKERFIRFMVDNGVLSFGEFQLQSGRVSPYYIDTSNYRSASQIAKLGRFYAECMIENNIHSGMLYGISNSEAPLVTATSMALFEKYGCDMEYVIGNAKEERLAESRNITILEDTLTSGRTLCDALDSIRKLAGGSSIDVVVSVDRMEKGEYPAGAAKCHIEEKFDVKIYSIVDLGDIIRAIENGVIAAPDRLDSLLSYRREYGGRQDAD